MSDIVICPFYQFEKKQTLYCEGAKIKFPSRTERNFWMKRHCSTWKFKMCKNYTELMKKYE